MRQIILDTETTGLRPEEGHRIIEIGCLEMVSRRLTGKQFHYYINPEREVDAGAQAVHGITTEFLKDKPLFSSIVDEFLEFVKDAELIIHNAPFDVGFLNHELSLLNKGYFKLAKYCRVVDTLALARQMHVGQRNSLDALCKRYSVDNSRRDLHGALIDCNLLSQVYLAMTGGQESFFDSMERESDNTAREESVEMAKVDGHRLVVLKADADELAAHENYLSEMDDCVWKSS